MRANPMLMPPTALEVFLSWRPWLIEVAHRHMRAEPGLAEGRFGPDAETATSGFAQPLIMDGFAAMVRPMLARQGIDARGWPSERVLATVPQAERREVGDEITREYMAVLNFALSGEKTFLFSPNLSARLADAEMKVPVELFALPFRSCMFVYDNDTARDALYAISHREPKRTGPVSVFVTLMGRPGGDETLNIYANHTLGGDILMTTIRSLRLDTAETVEDALRTVHPEREDDGRNPHAVGDEVFFGPGLRFCRLVMNSVLYLSSADPDLSAERPNRLPDGVLALPPKKRAHFEKLLERASRAPFVHVGEKVDKPPPVPSDGTGKKLDVRFKVRAHWRSQAHGEGRRLRKAILIDEHWKGPDAAEIVSRPYLVE